MREIRKKGEKEMTEVRVTQREIEKRKEQIECERLNGGKKKDFERD